MNIRYEYKVKLSINYTATSKIEGNVWLIHNTV